MSSSAPGQIAGRVDDWARDWDGVRRVLAVRLDNLGDVLMTTPALRALHDGGRRQVTLLTSPHGAAVGRLVPEVDEVIECDPPWVKATAEAATSEATLLLAERLREGRFDAAVIFTVYSQNPLPAALLCYLADIPMRLAHCRENPYALLTHWVRETEPEAGIRHEVRRQLDLVAAVGASNADERLSLRVSEAARGRVRALLEVGGVDLDRPWVVLHPGASAASRRYPAEAFAQAARELAEVDGWQVVLSGSQEEHALVAQVATSMRAPSLDLSGALDLEELAALLEAAPLLIANNSGPAHIAAAVGTPVVDLYALTNPQHAPWGVPHRVLFQDVPCRFCYRSVCPEGHHLCLAGVPPRAVAAAARELLCAASEAGRSAQSPGAALPLAMSVERMHHASVSTTGATKGRGIVR